MSSDQPPDLWGPEQPEDEWDAASPGAAEGWGRTPGWGDAIPVPGWGMPSAEMPQVDLNAPIDPHATVGRATVTPPIRSSPAAPPPIPPPPIPPPPITPVPIPPVPIPPAPIPPAPTALPITPAPAGVARSTMAGSPAEPAPAIWGGVSAEGGRARRAPTAGPGYPPDGRSVLPAGSGTGSVAGSVGGPGAGSISGTRGIAVSCRGLVFIYHLEGYDVVALSGVDLDIEASESVALLGPSGAGKSTLLAVVAGLLKPAAGRLLVGGHDVAKASPAELQQMRARSVGVVLQGTGRNLLPYLSCEQNVRFAQRGLSAGQRRGLPPTREVLGLVGLAGRSRHRLRPNQLAPGERQRLALAVALSNRPGLLLADEPTSQLDTHARDEVLAALNAVSGSGTTVVVVTHDPAVSAAMGRTVTIRDGRVGAEGRRGEDYAVVGRDGSLHLPPDVVQAIPPGTLVRVWLESDGSARLLPAQAPADDPAGRTP
jgi:putative ABC transport system ATP-binding protein